jgi:hypothetical protein
VLQAAAPEPGRAGGAGRRPASAPGAPRPAICSDTVTAAAGWGGVTGPSGSGKSGGPTPAESESNRGLGPL